LISETLLVHGDIVRAGEHVFEFLDDSASSEKIDLEFLTPDRTEPPNSEWVKIKAQAPDLFSKSFDYDDVYLPEPALGRMVIAYYNPTYGGYPPAYDTGMRKGEILGLKWTKVDLNAKCLRLAAMDTKSKKPRIVHLTPRVIEALTSLPGRRKGHVFKKNIRSGRTLPKDGYIFSAVVHRLFSFLTL